MGEFWHEHGTLTEQVYPGMAHSINMPEMRDIQRFLETNGFIRPQIGSHHLTWRSLRGRIQGPYTI